jgi:hypothetical protein
MASSVKKFMRDDVYGWIASNIEPELKGDMPSKSDFWVVPLAPDHPQYQSEIDKLLPRFEATKLGHVRIFDGLAISVLKENDRLLVCGVYQDGQKKVLKASMPYEGLQEYELSFLQKIALLSRVDAKATRLLDPQVWRKIPIFEADIEEYFPHMICFEVGEEASKDPDDAHILKFILSLELGAANALAAKDDLVTVMLSMPESEHDWLVYQLLYATLSGRDSNFFVELYKLVEFFFPLSKVTKLKKSINFGGSYLALLNFCMNDLGWHVNHQLGSRLALNYADVSFAEIMLGKKFESSKEQEKKFKEDAMEKITNLRHSLVYQIFKKNEPHDFQVEIATRSLISFLISSFQKYNEEITS